LTPIAVIVDTSALLKVIATALVAGIGITIAFSLAILGATRFADMRRDERPLEARLYGALTLLALAVVLAAVAFAILITTSK
jgi:hypothetical protein